MVSLVTWLKPAGKWRVKRINGVDLAVDPETWINCPEDKVYRDDRRSFVKRISIDGFDLMAKQPRNKNNKLWMRLTTLWRNSEVQRQYDGMLVLAELGIASTEPRLAIEKRRWGVVIDSWLFYEFREAEPLEDNQLLKIIAPMQTLHDNNYLHSDPHLGNFLYTPDKEVLLIDCEPKPNLLGGFGITHNWLLLFRSSPKLQVVREALSSGRIDPLHAKLSGALHGLRQARHKIRKKLRDRK